MPSPATGPAWARLSRGHTLGALLAVVALWFALGVGLVSSNDGAHLALARALALRGEATIDPDVALTLGVDLALREGHAYSDRPPGTALLVLAPVALGGRLDGALARATEARGRVLVRPASRPYVATYAARFPDATPLYRLQGSVAAARLVAASCGAVGLALLVWFARHLALSPPAAAVAALALAGSLWGPYSTALFAHVPAGVALLAAALAYERLSALDPRDPTHRRGAAAAGALGGLAIITDYSLLVAVVPLTLLLAPRRSWPWVLLGAAGPTALAACYHTVAFGSPWAIGYDHARMTFARSRASTFAGDPLHGAYTLFGPGAGGGLLAQSPALLIGALALGRLRPRLLLALAPWIALLCFHRTPGGGAGADHRYLIPALPFFALGLGALWERRARWGRAAVPAGAALLLLVAIAPLAVWAHFLAWRGG